MKLKKFYLMIDSGLTVTNIEYDELQKFYRMMYQLPPEDTKYVDFNRLEFTVICLLRTGRRQRINSEVANIRGSSWSRIYLPNRLANILKCSIEPKKKGKSNFAVIKFK